MLIEASGPELVDNVEQEGMEESDEIEVVNVLSIEKRVKLRDVTCLLREGSSEWRVPEVIRIWDLLAKNVCKQRVGHATTRHTFH